MYPTLHKATNLPHTSSSLKQVKFNSDEEETASPVMSFCKLFSRALVATFALAAFTTTAIAQTDSARPRQVTTTTEINGSTRLENEPVIVSLAPTVNPATVAPTENAAPRTKYSDQMLLAAIEARLGTPYRMGATGPYRFDCSGFVWSVYQSAGIDFERSSARSLWMRFAPASDNEKATFGTLVFFNNLRHVGIVADANGFYHASTSQGVVYSPFNDYWSARIDGFRRIPAAAIEVATASQTKSR